MVKPYSEDLRERVVGSVESGRSCRQTARLFEVSVASVVRWSQRKRATGSVAASAMGSRLQRILLGERDWILARLGDQPDVTLRALVRLRPPGRPARSLGSLCPNAASVRRSRHGTPRSA